MMTLYEKIKTIYPKLDDAEFLPGGTILLQDDSDGKGPYIKKWEHPDFDKPTNEQLKGL